MPRSHFGFSVKRPGAAVIHWASELVHTVFRCVQHLPARRCSFDIQILQEQVMLNRITCPPQISPIASEKPMTTTYQGACFCGAVHIEIVGEPEAMGYCHCRSCRSWSASPVNAFTLWKPDAVRVVS